MGFEGEVERLAWMPAHCSIHHVGNKALSNGSKLSQVDLRANSLVDVWAKRAAAAQCVGVSERRRILVVGEKLASIARWIGICGAAANHFPLDSNGSGSRRDHARDSDAVPKRRLATQAHPPPTLPVKRKRQPSPTGNVTGDLSACPRWAALRDRALSKVTR